MDFISSDAIQTYLVVLLVGWASGISLYLSVGLLGAFGAMGFMALPEDLQILTHPMIIGVAFTLYAIEFFADKVPYVDSAWDSAHTIIRPVGAAMVGYFAGTEYGPIVQTAFALTTGTVALDTHAVKAASRLAINTSPEPVTNVGVSVAEDVSVVALYWLFIKHPIIATGLILVFLIGSFFVLRMMWKFVKKIFSKRKNIGST